MTSTGTKIQAALYDYFRDKVLTGKRTTRAEWASHGPRLVAELLAEQKALCVAALDVVGSVNEAAFTRRQTHTAQIPYTALHGLADAVEKAVPGAVERLWALKRG